MFICAGPVAPGSIDLEAEADRLEGVSPSDEFGAALAGGGDLNGDGFPDLAIGAPHANDATYNGHGAAYVVFGGGSP